MCPPPGPNEDTTDERTDVLRILVVEDDPSTQMLFGTLLSKMCEVDVEGDPRAGLERATETAYDLVLLDIYLQDEKLDGVGLLKELRTLDTYREVPVVAITAYALPGDRERFIEEGFDEYVSKPFERTHLIELVEELTGES